MKKLGILLAGGLLLAAFTAPVCAQSARFVPYESYEYNSYDESVEAPAAYLPAQVITAASLGLEEPFYSLQDVFYQRELGRVFLLDGEGGRIVELDQDLRLKQEHKNFVDEDGATVTLSGAQGLFVDGEGTMYVADTGNSRVLIIDRSGQVKHIITRPDEALSNTDAPFDVENVLLDGDGNLYLTARSINLGIFVYGPDYQFEKFWGSNTVARTGEALLDYLRKQFMTKEQREKSLDATPVTITNFTIDAHDFIYTLSPYKPKQNTKVAVPGLLRKLNYKGEDLLGEDTVFGDVEWDRLGEGKTRKNQFIDVSVDDQGFINLLDSTFGRVMQYSEDGQLIGVFGGLGSQVGTFGQPVAVESVDDRTLVLDNKKNCLVEFVPTAYAAKFRSAYLKMQDFDMEGSLADWNALLMENTNGTYAYKGIGMVHYLTGDYSQAMAYFRLADDHENYSNAFVQYRVEFLQANYLWILAGILAVAVVLTLLIRLAVRRLRVPTVQGYSRMESKYLLPLYSTIHPADAFSQFKSRKNASWRMSLLIVLAWLAFATLGFFCEGFCFNTHRPMDFSPPAMLVQTIGMYVLFVGINWAVCTLLEGKGTLKEIASMTAYALLPYILSIAVNIPLSNLLSQNEAVFLQIVTTIGLVWSGLLLLTGLYSVHQYSMKKTLLSVLLTIAGMVVSVFLVILLYSLLQQTVSFGISVYEEGRIRWF